MLRLDDLKVDSFATTSAAMSRATPTIGTAPVSLLGSCVGCPSDVTVCLAAAVASRATSGAFSEFTPPPRSLEIPMKKLTLEDLAVDSFATTPAAGSARGTVLGHAVTHTCDAGCPLSYGGTCVITCSNGCDTR